MKFSYQLAAVLLMAVAIPCFCQVQTGEMWCHWDVDTNILKAEMYIFKNGSNATNAYFAEQLTTTTFEENTDPECAWTGDGSFNNPWTSRAAVDFSTDGGVGGNSTCGMEIAESNRVYYWFAHSQIEYPLFVDGDIMFQFTCNISYRLPTEVSFAGVINPYNETHEIYPSAGLLKMKATDLNSVTPKASFELGEDFQLLLSYQPENRDRPGTNADLAAWGAYCEKLYAEPPDRSRRVYMLNASSCPLPDSEFLVPDRGFLGSRPTNPLLNNLFESVSGAIEAARFDKASSDSVIISCEARFCALDNKVCEDPCGELTNRRKRSNRVKKVTTVITVTDIAPDNEGSPKKQQSGVPTYAWVIIGAGALLVICVVVVCTVCVLGRMRAPPKYDHQHNSNTSSNSVYQTKPAYQERPMY